MFVCLFGSRLRYTRDISYSSISLPIEGCSVETSRDGGVGWGGGGGVGVRNQLLGAFH